MPHCTTKTVDAETTSVAYERFDSVFKKGQISNSIQSQLHQTSCKQLTTQAHFQVCSTSQTLDCSLYCSVHDFQIIIFKLGSD